MCKAWHHLGFNEELWASDCLESFQQEPREATLQLMRTQYRSVLLAKCIDDAENIHALPDWTASIAAHILGTLHELPALMQGLMAGHVFGAATPAL